MQTLKSLLTKPADTPAHAASGPIGLDLGAAGARMIQLTAAGAAIAVRAAASGPLAPAGAARPELNPAGRRSREVLRERVQQLLAAGPFAGRQVVAAVPKDLLHIRTVRLPAGAELTHPDDRYSFRLGAGTSAAGEAAWPFPFDLRDALVQVLPTGRIGNGPGARWEVIVLAAPRRELDAFVSSLHAAGLVVQSLDAEPCALYRSVTRGSAPAEDVPAHVLIDVGRRRTQVVIGRGANVHFIKPIEVGAEHLDQAVVRKLGVTPAEARLVHRRVSGATGTTSTTGAGGTTMIGGEGGAEAPRPTGAAHDAVRQALSDATRAAAEQLARGLTAYLRYHAVTFRGLGPDRVRLVGGQADNDMLCASLSALLGLPVEPDDPFRGVDTAAMPAGDRSATGVWATAIGLALKKLPRITNGTG